jgi:phosphoglycolate phosphatase
MRPNPPRVPAFRFNTIVFDLDGTLADTAPDLAASLNHTLATLGRPSIDPELVRSMIGHGARALLRRGLAATGEVSEPLVKTAFPMLLDHYGANICRGTRPYPGLEEVLDALAKEGAALAICTNKPEALSRKLIEALGWSGRFAAIVGGDTLPTRKPDPAMLHEAIERAGGGRAVLVGDSIIDADTARAAHVPFVAVSFGFSDRPAAQLGADAVIDSYSELVPALTRL